MKKNRVSLIIVLILVIVSVILILKNSTTTLRKEMSDFAVQDTASITKVFMSDKKNNSILLVRQSEGKWRLNDKYDASIPVVNILLKTMYNMVVKAPVAKIARNNVLTRMAAAGIKVEVYQRVYRIDLTGFIDLRWFPHEKLTKTFYVGGDTPDNSATFMLMEGTSEPCIVVIPSFRGFLSTRFIPDEDLWRDQTVFRYALKDIRSVKMEFSATPDSSFIINAEGKLKYSLTSIAYNRTLPYDTLKLLVYLSAFQDLRYEALLNKLDRHKKDSITGSMPWHIITVTDINGKATQIKTFHKNPEYGEYYDEAIKETVKYDRDRLYALLNGDRDFTLIQFFVFEKILKSINYFKKN